MWWLLLIPVVLLVVGFVLFRPVPLVIKRHRAIKAPRDEVFDKIRDFRSWREWSPWLLAEPDAQVTYTKSTTNVGGKYSWDGDIVGTGEMEHLEIREPSRLDMVLRFTKPFKSTAKVTMEFRDVNHGTDVTWSMNSKMPAVMVPMFRTMIGMDYDRGLHMLSDLMHTGSILSRLEVHGVVERPTIDWIGVESSCPIDHIALSMTKSFEELKKRLESARITPTLCLSIYTKWDFKTATCTYIAAFGVAEGTSCAGTTSGRIPAHQAYGISHFGPYDHLGNAWSAAHAHTRAKKLKCPKGGPFPYEIYVTEPDTVPDPDIQTDVFIPVR